MMRPENMSLIEIIVPAGLFTQLIDRMYSFGAVAIEHKALPGGELLPFTSFDDQQQKQAQEKLSLLHSALSILNISADIKPEEMTLSKIMYSIHESVTIATDVISADREMKSASESLNTAQTGELMMQWLRSIGIDPSLCVSSERITVYTGTIPASAHNLSFSDDTIIEQSSPVKGNKFIAALTRSSNGHRLLDTLERAGFKTVPTGITSNHIKALKNKITTAKKNLKKNMESAHLLSAAFAALNDFIRATAETHYARSSKLCTHISCWVPSQSAKKFSSAMIEAADGCCLTNIISAERAISEKVFGYEEVPSLLTRSKLLEPFRLIVSTYGCPAYRHADPIIISALGFVVMFGMMFADIGHGMVILIAGLLLRLFTRLKNLRDAGMLMLYSGMASVAGGFIFGSFFGREDIIHPLWFSPMENTNLFLLIGIASGLFMISAGILLNIIQKFWQRDYSNAVFSPWGILTLGFYWLCAASLAGTVRYGTLPVAMPVVILCVALPIMVLIAGGAIMAHRHNKEEAAEVAFRPVEIILGLLSNTVSFVRVSAFGLTHIALMTAVYLIASMMSGSSVSHITTIIQGNIFVICLEGLIVTIQCLRLQFYEFYSKFFDIAGKQFIPLRTIPN